MYVTDGLSVKVRLSNSWSKMVVVDKWSRVWTFEEYQKIGQMRLTLNDEIRCGDGVEHG